MSATSIPSLDQVAPSLAGRPEAWSQCFLKPAILIRVVLYLTTAIYLRTVLFDYVYDDTVLITLNPEMASWKLVPSFFTHSFWSFLDIPRLIDFYRPLVMVVLAAVRHLAGPAPASPAARRSPGACFRASARRLARAAASLLGCGRFSRHEVTTGQSTARSDNVPTGRPFQRREA